MTIQIGASSRRPSTSESSSAATTIAVAATDLDRSPDNAESQTCRNRQTGDKVEEEQEQEEKEEEEESACHRLAEAAAPMDHGPTAWLVVAGAFCCQMCAFGWVNCALVVLYTSRPSIHPSIHQIE